MTPRALRERLAVAAVVLVTAVAAVIVTGFVRLNPDLAALLPSQGDGAVLARYLRTFAGGGVGVILIEGPRPEENAEVATAVAVGLRGRETVAFASERVEASGTHAPLLLWRTADAPARERLAAALTPEGMRERLAGTKQLLLLPGTGSLSASLSADPLRLSELVRPDGKGVSAGVPARSDGFFANEDGSAHLVVLKSRGQALRGAEAKAFVADVDASLAAIRREHPEVRIGVTGPHSVAAEMEELLRADLTRSGIISTVLASLAFALVFRRARALLAILPPLALGTLWTAALASAWPGGISAIAVAFTSVVVGVGFDTGVHVYAALLEARREGLSPSDAAHAARRRAARPVLVAATIAGVAFASLSLSSVDALAQLGLLCAAGEILTAIAIVVVTPAIGAWLERGAAPRERASPLLRALGALTGTRTRAGVAVGLLLACGASVLVTGVHVSDSLVAVRPNKLPSLQVERAVFELFGGRPQPFIVLVEASTREEAMRRADVLAEGLASQTELVARVDALVAVAPSEATQRERLAERDGLDLPSKAAELERALVEAGFKIGRFQGALAAMRAPPADVIPPAELLSGDREVLGARYLATDGGAHLAALHVHVRDPQGAAARLESAARALDGSAAVTGYARLEADLRSVLGKELPRLGLVAAALVVGLLVVSLRSAREVALAVGVLAVGLGALLGAASLAAVPLHIYSALVIPVLLGISVDEAMFLLHQARAPVAAGEDPIARALVVQGRPVFATALTTSAGFVALAFADYEGLRDLGVVGALGNASTLVVALVLVPAGLRLLRPPRPAA